jgi:actin-like ATPase involved in cell morphogenesis
METTIRINTDLLTPEIIEGIKKMFPHKTVDITIQSADDTEYIIGNEAYSKELQERKRSIRLKNKPSF